MVLTIERVGWVKGGSDMCIMRLAKPFDTSRAPTGFNLTYPALSNAATDFDTTSNLSTTYKVIGKPCNSLPLKYSLPKISAVNAQYDLLFVCATLIAVNAQYNLAKSCDKLACPKLCLFDELVHSALYLFL